MSQQVDAGPRPKVARRIVVASGNGRSLIGEDMPLIRRLLSAGHQVLCLAADLSQTEALSLGHAGAKVEAIDLEPDRFALMPGRQVTQRLAKILSAWQPDCVIARGHAVMPAVAVAAKRATCPRIVAVYEHVEMALDSGKSKPGTAIASLDRAFDATTHVLCYNYDDAARLEVEGSLPEGLAALVLPGYGVDLEDNATVPLPPIGRGLTFLMAAELRLGSGILDFCQAARILKERAPQAEFKIVGKAVEEDDALTLGDLEPFAEVVDYAGDVSELKPQIALAHIVVCSTHGQAHPALALPALAMGRPVVASDASGSRELVDERVNGCHVAPADPAALANAMGSFLKRPDLIPAMARASRQKAERRYDRKLVLAAYLDLLGLDDLVDA